MAWGWPTWWSCGSARSAGDELETVLAELEAEARAALAAQGVEAPEILRRAALRYEGSDSTLEVPVSDHMRADFEAAHKARFGFDAPETEVVVETAIVEAVGQGRACSCGSREPSPGVRLGSGFRQEQPL